MNHFSFSLSKLISSLINQPNKQEYVSLPDEEIKPTTIRLDPSVRKFCDDQSAKMGISVQAFIAMVLHGVMLESTNPVKAELLLIYERFFEVFKAHNIAISDIPAILSEFNFSLSTLADQNKLLDLINENVITGISVLFHANPLWLKGVSNRARVENLEWYKKTYSFCSHLFTLQKEGLSPHLMLIKTDKSNLNLIEDSPDINNNITLIIRLKKEYLPGKYFYYYQVCRPETWNYWRSRHQLKSIILFCDIFGLSFGGYTIALKSFIDLIQEGSLACNIITMPMLGGYTWFPEDYIDHYEGEYHTQKNPEEACEVYEEFFYAKLDNLLVMEGEPTQQYKLKRLRETYTKFTSTKKINC